MLNQCQFIGNLGADPEVKSTQKGDKVANLRLAVTEKWKSNGEQKERVEWVTVTVWGDGLVGIVERFTRKGSKVFVQGKMQTRKWQDQGGNDRYSTEIVLNGFDAKIVLLDGAQERQESRGNGGSGNAGRGDRGGGAWGDDLDNDEIPFIRSTDIL